MYPFLVVMYVRLAHREEAEARQTFGTEYECYAAMVPRWLPRWHVDDAGERPA